MFGLPCVLYFLPSLKHAVLYIWVRSWSWKPKLAAGRAGLSPWQTTAAIALSYISKVALCDMLEIGETAAVWSREVVGSTLFVWNILSKLCFFNLELNFNLEKWCWLSSLILLLVFLVDLWSVQCFPVEFNIIYITAFWKEFLDTIL